MTFGDTSSTINTMNEQKNKGDGLKIGFLDAGNSTRPTKPVIVPRAVNTGMARRLTNSTKQEGTNNIMHQATKNISEEKESKNLVQDFDFEDIETTIPTQNEQVDNETVLETPVETVKRGRGRPRKNPAPTSEELENKPKRGRGRPRKNQPVEENVSQNLDDEETILPGFDNVQQEDTILPGFEDVQEEATLPGFDDIQEEDEDITLPGFDEVQADTTLPGFDEEQIRSSSKDEDIKQNAYSVNTTRPYTSSLERNNQISNYNGNGYNANYESKVTNLLSKDKKIVSFVGTTKNGTSFIVNNLGKTLAGMGIKTAILDLTTNRNSYYIYTNNDEKLRGIAYESIKKLRSGIASGISADRNLDIYTALPGDKIPLEDVDNILTTLIQNYSAVLMDCDFDTLPEYFGASQEIYIIQSLDVLTIQPMTAFLRELKAKDVLKEEKLRVIINKEVKVRGLTPNVIIGGLSRYNEPSMSFMTELFNKDNMKYITIPFDTITYAKYLENVMDCEMVTSGYSREFNMKMKELANMVYPLIGNKYKPAGNYSYSNTFSSNMNNTLEQMKRKY